MLQLPGSFAAAHSRTDQAINSDLRSNRNPLIQLLQQATKKENLAPFGNHSSGASSKQELQSAVAASLAIHVRGHAGKCNSQQRFELSL